MAVTLTAQIRGMLRLELRKTLLGRRAVPIYLLGALPVSIVVLSIAVGAALGKRPDVGLPMASQFYATLFLQVFLRVLLFFGCVWVFMNLFRGEVLDRSLHYYFLSPVRREVLIVGKFLSGWFSASLVFGASALICFLGVYGYFGGQGIASMLVGSTAAGHLWAYLGIVVLGCLGYGALFLTIGLWLRSLLVPAMLIFLIEWANIFLPAALKKISVIFYLRSLLPVPLVEGAVAMVAEPVSVWFAVPGLLLFAAVALAAAAWRIRRMEIAYDGE